MNYFTMGTEQENHKNMLALKTSFFLGEKQPYVRPAYEQHSNDIFQRSALKQ